MVIGDAKHEAAIDLMYRMRPWEQHNLRRLDPKFLYYWLEKQGWRYVEQLRDWVPFVGWERRDGQD